jgi:hypothetical protein
MSRIELAEMVEELRQELQKAVEQGEGRKVRFELEKVTLEAQVEVARKAEGKAGVKFWVFSEAEASGGVSQSRGHKIVLELLPRSDGGERVQLGRGRTS